ncbi:cysteine desulfurase [Niallia circulans]|uniref:IscS subfamily cysteine desulfurase n=1 Tax=Niallia circulans TaxID=1397 RepID=UPI00077C53A7|nr:IscS subfamily cysteine desulfurase [Niallia circulans]MDR4315264.1 aminotransferase class V-fold PLP-dependent enzyme [Niallia circulans]MED3840920.1 IscS subfamily cysteine desulfurase [Niallia circulans]MED4241491.1 IscS subfamily cysteine desulfurase [Niallia circulans]MED4248151.1 IscS subfamily cysteine desulfurase [Niallia circulans]QKH61389.1 IscS subfamily cysteine desulfurase [Niallia circulans]
MKYFDYAATTSLDPDAASTYVEIACKYFGNSNSLHDMGDTASRIVENCRDEWGRLINVDKNGIYFTSGGTESNFLILHSLLMGTKKEGKHLITSTAEHASIHSAMHVLADKGYEITYLPLSKTGLIDTRLLEETIRPDTVLVSIQHVNSEIGAIQSIKEISTICKRYHILFHSDMVQSFGKIEVKEVTPYVDALSLSSHKFYGPKGVGIAYINPNVPWIPIVLNGSHENGFRSGTVNTAGIASMTVAAQKACSTISKNETKLSKFRKLFTKMIPKESVTIFECTDQYPGIIGLRAKGIEGQWLMLECNRRGFAISTGSACQVGKQAPSKTMEAFGLAVQEAKEFVRISMGKDTKEDDVRDLANTIKQLAIKRSIPK